MAGPLLCRSRHGAIVAGAKRVFTIGTTGDTFPEKFKALSRGGGTGGPATSEFFFEISLRLLVKILSAAPRASCHVVKTKTRVSPRLHARRHYDLLLRAPDDLPRFTGKQAASTTIRATSCPLLRREFSVNHRRRLWSPLSGTEVFSGILILCNAGNKLDLALTKLPVPRARRKRDKRARDFKAIQTVLRFRCSLDELYRLFMF